MVFENGSEVATFDQTHVHIQPAVDLAVAMDRNDVRIGQPRCGMHFPSEPFLEGFILSSSARKTFSATTRSLAVSKARRRAHATLANDIE